MLNHKDRDIVLIRHAESLFNEATCTHGIELGLMNKGWLGMIENPEFNTRVTYNKMFMDPPISKHGEKQCINRQKECSEIKPDLILVSPYLRALQTCNNLFGKTNVPVIVEPIFAEVFRYSCDIPMMWEENKKLFPHYNFSKVDKLGDEWLMESLHPSIKSKLDKITTNEKISEFMSKRERMLELLSTKEIHEHSHMMRERMRNAKMLLSQYREKYNKIVVVAHYYVIEFLKSKGFDEEGELLNYQGIENCRPYYENLNQLKKIM